MSEKTCSLYRRRFLVLCPVVLSQAVLLVQEYEEKAVELGLNHNKRLGLRQRLKDVRLSCPLFDTTQWVRDLEKIYFKMWDIQCEGKGPRTFDV